MKATYRVCGNDEYCEINVPFRLHTDSESHQSRSTMNSKAISSLREAMEQADGVDSVFYFTRYRVIIVYAKLVPLKTTVTNVLVAICAALNVEIPAQIEELEREKI